MFLHFFFFFVDYWAYKENRRKVFDEIAEKENFDPQEPENWYKCNFLKILGTTQVFAKGKKGKGRDGNGGKGEEKSEGSGKKRSGRKEIGGERERK